MACKCHGSSVDTTPPAFPIAIMSFAREYIIVTDYKMFECLECLQNLDVPHFELLRPKRHRGYGIFRGISPTEYNEIRKKMVRQDMDAYSSSSVFRYTCVDDIPSTG
jgi:hypothetical protein